MKTMQRAELAQQFVWELMVALDSADRVAAARIRAEYTMRLFRMLHDASTEPRAKSAKA